MTARIERYKWIEPFWPCQFLVDCGNILRNNNEEFDPGSGWTLAAGLTHASRGVTLELASDDDRRTGA